MKVMALDYFLIALLRQNFLRVVGSNSTKQIINRHGAVQAFSLFVENNYLNRRSAVALWNVYLRDKDCRTNNFADTKLEVLWASSQLTPPLRKN